METIVQSLLPERTGPVISGATAELTRGIQRQAPIPEVFDLPKAQLIVSFEGNSHRLTEPGLRALRSIAAALKDPRLADAPFQVGSHAYDPANLAGAQVLTTRRATTITQHLNVFYDIPTERLIPVGYGTSAPFDLAQAAHPMNNRIELINLAPLNK
ncbi:OmpA family protein [Actibacterium mucosum]|uniref:OmpA family protein n=1 Tax=Actibacterium mucosum TaxID=1087332 RepID=UPI0013789522|nr:OmpA family protein [Actibacterium mucosum]